MGRSWVVALMLLLVACGGSSPAADTDPSGQPATSPAATGGSATPTAVGGAAGGPTATTVPAAPGPWEPPCRERLAQAAPTARAYDAAMERFGPLGSAPVLDLVLPKLTEAGPDAIGEVGTIARAVDGGVLVGLSSNRPDHADSSVLSVIDDDGQQRWVRCLAGNAVNAWVAPPSERPRTALVATYANTRPVGTTWQLVALDTGATTTGFTDAAGRAGIDPSDLDVSLVADFSSTAALLHHSAADPGGGASTEFLVRYDLVVETFTVVPPPPVDGTSQFVEYRLGSDDNVVAIAGSTVIAVYHDGGWRRDDAIRLAARPIEVRFSVVDDPTQTGLEGVDALGTVVWRNDEVADPRLEGVGLVSDGPITMAGVCLDPSPDGGCNRYELVGVDTATGAIRWRLPGLRALAAAADGWALVADGGLTSSSVYPDEAPGYVMVDDRTGVAGDDAQQWPAGSFAQGCCGEGDYLWVRRAGGVIFAAGDGHLRVWYPAAVSDGTHTVTLP